LIEVKKIHKHANIGANFVAEQIETSLQSIIQI